MFEAEELLALLHAVRQGVMNAAAVVWVAGCISLSAPFHASPLTTVLGFALVMTYFARRET